MLIRASFQRRVMFGRSPLLCGRSWRSPASDRSTPWLTTRSSTTASAATTRAAAWTRPTPSGWCWDSRATVRARSTTWWSSAGTATRRRGRRSARCTCSCRGRTWATARPTSAGLLPGTLLNAYNQHRHRCYLPCQQSTEFELLSSTKSFWNAALSCACKAC